MLTPAYPAPPSTVTVTGGTVNGDGTVTATAATVSLRRALTPIWVDGSPGRILWSATVTADRAVTSARFTVTSGVHRRSTVRTGVPASSVLELDLDGSPVELLTAVVCPVGTVLTVREGFSQNPRIEAPIILAEPGFGDPSIIGADPPPASASLPASEAYSPARRSPQVRQAQRIGSIRPDLLPRCSSLL